MNNSARSSFQLLAVVGLYYIFSGLMNILDCWKLF